MSLDCGVRIVESQTKYKARDGRSFDTLEAAESYDKLIGLKETYVRARKVYARAVAESFKTADGQDFDISKWHYYRVTPWYDQMPVVQKISITLPDFEIDDGGEGQLTMKCPSRSGPWERVSVDISKMYASKKKAALACVEARSERLRQLREETEAMAAKVSGSKEGGDHGD